MAQKNRSLKFTGSGWGCSMCGWTVPFLEQTDEPEKSIKIAFERHDCADYPLRVKSRENMNEAVSRRMSKEPKN